MEHPIYFPRMGVPRMRRMSLQVHKENNSVNVNSLVALFLFTGKFVVRIDIEEPRDAVLVTNGDSEIGQVFFVVPVLAFSELLLRQMVSVYHLTCKMGSHRTSVFLNLSATLSPEPNIIF